MATAREILMNHIVKNGTPMDPDDYYGGGEALDAGIHIRHEGCEIAPIDSKTVTFNEETVTSFAGTFNDPDETVFLMVTADTEDGKGITCKCGKYTNLTLGISDGLTSLMTKLINESD